MGLSNYLSWDFLGAPSGKPSSGGSPIGSVKSDLTTSQKIGRAGQIANTFLGGIFDEQDKRMQRQRDLEKENAGMYENYQSRLPALLQARRQLADRTAQLSALSRMF